MRNYTELDQFLPYVLRDCPNVPRDVALMDIREAAIEFCIRTRYWREEIVPQQTVPSTAVTEYEIFTQAPDSRPVAVFSLQADGVPLSPMTEDELDRNHSNWRMAIGMPTGFVVPVPEWVRPFPIAANKVVTLTGKVAVAPTRTGNYVPSAIFDNYAGTIASMAKARLMKIPGKPWTNLEVAAFELEMSHQALDVAISETSRNFATAPKRRVKPVWF